MEKTKQEKLEEIKKAVEKEVMKVKSFHELIGLMEFTKLFAWRSFDESEKNAEK